MIVPPGCLDVLHTRRNGTVSPRPLGAPRSAIMGEPSAAHYLTNVKFPSRSSAASHSTTMFWTPLLDATCVDARYLGD